MKNIILASTSTIHGGTYLEYLLPTLETFFKDIDTVLFVPYARPSGVTYEQYTEIVAKAFSKINKNIIGLHSCSDLNTAIRDAKGIFIGGGNTFELLNKLYKKNILDTLREVVFKGTSYLGTSAGSNICGQTIKTSNDMPIVYPPSFNGMGLVDFNINPHYLDPDITSKHMGETRETRIKEYLVYNDIPVIGLREGSWLEINNDTIKLLGEHTARWFEKDKEIIEITKIP